MICIPHNSCMSSGICCKTKRHLFPAFCCLVNGLVCMYALLMCVLDNLIEYSLQLFFHGTLGPNLPPKSTDRWCILHPRKIRWNPKVQAWRTMFLVNRVLCKRSSRSQGVRQAGLLSINMRKSPKTGKIMGYFPGKDVIGLPNRCHNPQAISAALEWYRLSQCWCLATRICMSYIAILHSKWKTAETPPKKNKNTDKQSPQYSSTWGQTMILYI